MIHAHVDSSSAGGSRTVRQASDRVEAPRASVNVEDWPLRRSEALWDTSERNSNARAHARVTAQAEARGTSQPRGDHRAVERRRAFDAQWSAMGAGQRACDPDATRASEPSRSAYVQPLIRMLGRRKTVYQCGSHLAGGPRPGRCMSSRCGRRARHLSARQKATAKPSRSAELQTSRYSPMLNRGCIISAGAMNQPDPGLPLNCPTCGKPLRYVATKLSPATWYLYICPQDGLFEFPKDGRPSPQNLPDNAVRTLS